MHQDENIFQTLKYFRYNVGFWPGGERTEDDPDHNSDPRTAHIMDWTSRTG